MTESVLDLKVLKKSFPWLIILSIFHLLMPIIVTWDSAHYLSYLPILSGDQAWKFWDIARGPIFPMFLYFVGKLTLFGPYLNFKIVSLGMLVLTFFMIKSLMRDPNKNGKISNLYPFLLLMNPVTIGYINTLLTEFFAISLILFFIVFFFRSSKSNSRIRVINFIVQVLLCQILYLLKQSYALFPLLIVFFSLFVGVKLSIKIFLNKTTYFLFFVICILFAPFLWGKFIHYKGAIDQPSRNFSGILFYQLISASRDLKVEFRNADSLCTIEIYKVKLSHSGPRVVPCEDIKSPEKFAKNILEIYSTNITSYLISIGENFLGLFGFLEVGTFGFEDYSIALRAFRLDSVTSNVFYLSDELSLFAAAYRIDGDRFSYLNALNPIAGISKIFRIFVISATLVFMLFYLKNRRRFNSDQLNKVFIIALAGFMYIAIHTLIAFPIDRYGFPVFFIWAIFMPTICVYFYQIIKLSSLYNFTRAFFINFKK